MDESQPWSLRQGGWRFLWFNGIDFVAAATKVRNLNIKYTKLRLTVQEIVMYSQIDRTFNLQG